MAADGNIGIGTTDPGAALDINESQSNDALLLRAGTAGSPGTSTGNQIVFGYDQSTNYQHAIRTRHHSGQDETNAIDFYVWDYGTDAAGTIGTKHVMSLNAGKVGIGTTSPEEILEVWKDTGSIGEQGTISITDGGGAVNDYCSLWFKHNHPTPGNVRKAGIAHIKTGDYGVGDLVFINDSVGDTNDATLAANEVMRIDSAGNVGIGTTAPNADSLLHLKKTSGFTQLRLETDDTSGDLDFVEFYMDADTGADNQVWRIQAVGGSHASMANKLTFYDGTDSQYRMVIDGTGNVGIGTTSPGYNLEVAGTFYSAGSSVVYKENIEDLEVDPSLIHSLRPVSYDYKKKYKDFGYNVKEGKQLGLISEEVAETIPELAIMKDGIPKNVDYQKLSVVLLKEVQNLKKEVEELKK
jgi:hypothetical protein